MFGGLWFKLGAAALLLAGLASGVIYVRHLQAKAARVDQAEARATAAEKRALAIAETATKAAAQERGIGEALASFRAEIGAQSQSFREALTRAPLVHEVTREVNGVQVTCRERDPQRYRELFNQAVTGVASP